MLFIQCRYWRAAHQCHHAILAFHFTDSNNYSLPFVLSLLCWMPDLISCWDINHSQYQKQNQEGFILLLGCYRKCLIMNLKIFQCLQGVQKKMRRSFGLIALATNMLEGWGIIHWKGGIHSFVWSTKTFLYDIRELRYE